jgi:hypothetical protein
MQSPEMQIFYVRAINGQWLAISAVACAQYRSGIWSAYFGCRGPLGMTLRVPLWREEDPGGPSWRRGVCLGLTEGS